MIDMLNVVKEKLELSPDLRKKINWASKYTSTSITLEKGTLIKLEPTNIAYVDPHKVIINDIKFLFFNGVDCFYINSLNDKPVRINIGCPLKESQIKEYLNELNKYHATNFYIHSTFNHSIEDLPDEIIFNINADEKLFRLIPIIKDIDNPENVFNKFKL